MRNLAIECSGVTAAVGIFDGSRPLKTIPLSPGVPSVRAIAPALNELVSEFAQGDAARARPVDLIGITVGPGSFTGLRVGIATAKMLAMAWDVPVAAVDSLQVIAFQQALSRQFDAAPGQPFLVIPVLNAFRRQVFSALWRFPPVRNWPATEHVPGAPQEPSEGFLASGECLVDSCVIDAEAWIDDPVSALIRHDAARQTQQSVASEEAHSPAPFARSQRSIQGNVEPDRSYPVESACAAVGRILIAGPGLDVYQPAECERWQVADREEWEPRVESVAQLAWAAYIKGNTTDAGRLMPHYVRASAAEEKARNK